MKRLLLLIPLLVGCTNLNSKKDVYYNVAYSFSYDKHCYSVIIDDNKIYDVLPKNFYKINVYEYKTDNGITINNEYFLKSNELFVYVRQ